MPARMPVLEFPDPSSASEEGIVALGGDLHPQTLLLAYAHGIFPWPIQGIPLAWFSPAQRAVVEFDALHIPKSLAKERRRARFSFTIDRAFERVIESCAKTPRPGQDGTWITAPMKKAYVEMHRLGHAHSVEAWEGEVLAGGIYGMDCGGAFAAESMFYSRPYASKLALLHLIEHLRGRGLSWLDIQVMTPHMKALGAVEIPRDAFLARLRRARSERLKLFA
jgi:leucyl/phenylalanyl-tRNA--protein transferase